ncbi:hypothetical protein [Altererythrobacter sp. GH1-8]|uniref:hypothetical protein n=1 Tax=Altererythrobacter sp. GH1-8 TaxID=3349333 RepID=UPI00374CCFA6
MSDAVVPIAARLGFTHVSVVQTSPGHWQAVLWSKEDGCTPLAGDGSYYGAVDQAENYGEKKRNVVVDIPDEYGTIEVVRQDCGGFDVLQLSAGGGSAASLAFFGPHEREDAVRFALDNLERYDPCRLGRVGL